MRVRRLIVLSLVLQVGAGSAYASGLRARLRRAAARVHLTTDGRPTRPHPAASFAGGRSAAPAMPAAARPRVSTRAARHERRAMRLDKLKVGAGLTAMGAGIVAAVGGAITAIAVNLANGPEVAVGAALVAMVAGIATTVAFVAKILRG